MGSKENCSWGVHVFSHFFGYFVMVLRSCAKGRAVLESLYIYIYAYIHICFLVYYTYMHWTSLDTFRICFASGAHMFVVCIPNLSHVYSFFNLMSSNFHPYVCHMFPICFPYSSSFFPILLIAYPAYKQIITMMHGCNDVNYGSNLQVVPPALSGFSEL